MKNYYEILEVFPDASQDAIKEQYRFLVQAWHPDKFANLTQKIKAEEKTKEINVAYDVLRNPNKRAEYDKNICSSHPGTQPYSEGHETTQQRSQEEFRNRDNQDTTGFHIKVVVNGELIKVKPEDLIGARVSYYDLVNSEQGRPSTRDINAVRGIVRVAKLNGYKIVVHRFANSTSKSRAGK